MPKQRSAKALEKREALIEERSKEDPSWHKGYNMNMNMNQDSLPKKEVVEEVREYKRLFDRKWIKIDSPGFDFLVTYLQKKIHFTKFHRKEAVARFRCCYLYWFGPNPWCSSHDMDESFKEKLDWRNIKKKMELEEKPLSIGDLLGWARNIENKDTSVTPQDGPSTRVPDDDGDWDAVSAEGCDKKEDWLG